MVRPISPALGCILEGVVYGVMKSAHACISDLRWSNRSVLAYACSVEFPIVCDRAASDTCQLALATSILQALKLLLKPWAVVRLANGSVDSSLIRVRPSIGCPGFFGDSNTKWLALFSCRARRRIAMAWVLSGTRCSLLCFILSTGIVQMAWSRSISSHVAFVASLERLAVKTRNSRQSLVVSCEVEARTRDRAGCTSLYGRASWWWVRCFMVGSAPSMASPAGLVATKSWAMPHLKESCKRCLMRLASAGWVPQRGVRASITWRLVMALIGISPSVGNTCWARGFSHSSLYLPGLRLCFRIWWTAWAASRRVGAYAVMAVGWGGVGDLSSARRSCAFLRASFMPIKGYDPRPKSRLLPLATMRSTHERVPLSVMYRYRPLPSACLPGKRFLMVVAVSRMVYAPFGVGNGRISHIYSHICSLIIAVYTLVVKGNCKAVHA